jgi:RNA polymerase-binding transcription factor DksA
MVKVSVAACQTGRPSALSHPNDEGGEPSRAELLSASAPTRSSLLRPCALDPAVRSPARRTTSSVRRRGESAVVAWTPPPSNRRRTQHIDFLPKTNLELFMVRSAVSVPTIPAGRRGDDLASRVPDLRAALERQRDFRREQLAQVDLHRPTRTPSATKGAVDRAQEPTSALREVEALVAAGARRALTDIELALARIHTGNYGCCRLCGTGIPLAVLEAIPKTTLCLACQLPAELSAHPAQAALRARRGAEQRSAAR